jgi:hypothetical protein
MTLEHFDLTGKTKTLVAFNNSYDLGEPAAVPQLPSRFASCTPLFPVMHVKPLDVTNVHGRLHIRFALHKDGLDVSALYTYGNGYLVTTNARVAGGVLRKEGDDALAVQNAVRYRAAPIVTHLNLRPVKPDIVAPLLQVVPDTAGQFLVGVVSVAQKDP